MSEPKRWDGSLATWLTVIAIVVACLPVLVLSYLPMTDLPQHLALASILENFDDAGFGFDAYYTVDWFHTPYVLTYVLAVGLSYVMPLAIAMKVVVFLSVIAYPLGVLALLRAARKPLWFALLAIPLIYHRSFFWGFINFGLGIGLALAAFACFVEPRKSWRSDVLQAVLTLAATFCHVYGLAMIGALVASYMIVGGLREVRARPWMVAPVLAGALLWVWKSSSSRGYGAYFSPPFSDRLRELPASILGGYADRSELVVIALCAAAWLALAWPTLPTSRARLRGLQPVERVAYLCVAGNLVAYFVLPQATWTAKFIHFRHAFLACSMLPLLASTAALQRATLLVRALPAIAAAAAIANTWIHLAAFDREARAFDPIVASLPRTPKVISMIFDRNGAVMATDPYLHFAAYVQAEKGGLISMTFPEFFWNLPVERRPDSPAPPAPTGLEWSPGSYNETQFGYFYDFAIVRLPRGAAPRTSPAFPFEPIVESPPWYLYRRIRSR